MRTVTGIGARWIALTIGLVLACGPADEFQPHAECSAQPGPRSAQQCYVRDEARFAAIARNNLARSADYGADSTAARQEFAEFEANLRACGAEPDTAERPSDAALETWRCRQTHHRAHIARRPSPPLPSRP